VSKVLILGATGMLGSAVASHLNGKGVDLLVTHRSGAETSKLNTISKLQFDAQSNDIDQLLEQVGDVDFVINCIGVTKSHIADANLLSRATAVRVNSDFSLELAKSAEARKLKVVQIATDCVFSGNKGSYLESDSHDATDVYGKTKSLGESPSPAVMHLRVSTIGPEISRSTLLYEWVRNQPNSAEITGFTNHRWNGITTTGFAELLFGIISNRTFKPGVQHIVPQGQQTKDQLVRLITQKLGRNDLQITAGPADYAVDRTLATADASFNQNLWADAGYPEVPSIETLLAQI
jgi:dTDP-4-dehydrorhamnose reductase